MESIIKSIFDKETENDSWTNLRTGQNSVDKELEEFQSKQARIVVIGAGGGGSNTVTRLTEMGIKGAITAAVNTDARHLLHSTKADKKILIGKELTRGLGAGGYPEIGRKAAEESKGELKELLKGADLVFITCGLGGGTGTGSAPVIARLAKEAGAIVIATVTLPFKIEGARIGKAEDGLMRLRKVADTVIVIENQKLLSVAGNMPLKDAFSMADNLIATMIKGISETISQPSLVNLDYADVRAVMKSGGVAAIGVGSSGSENRAKESVQKALRNKLLEVDYKGATGALIQIIGGDDMRLDEINTIGEAVSQYLDPEAQVIWGARVLPEMSGKIEVITVITGVKSPYILGQIDERKIASGKRNTLSNELGIDFLR